VWAAASCFPILIVAGLYSAWGGIVPPQWNRLYVGSISPVPIAYILSITTLLGSFYYALYPGAVAIRSALWVPALALGVGLAASAPTTYGRIFGHWGGYLWELVRILPAPLDRSIVFMLLAPIGVVLVIGFYRGIRAMGHHQQALTWLISILAWSASFLPNRLIYQRYYEPMILIFCALAVAMSATIKLGNGQRLLLLALTVIQVAITFATAWWRTFLT
jgi:hypothetical protein